MNNKNQLASSGFGYGNANYIYDASGRIARSYIYDNSRPTTEILGASYTYATTEDGYSTYQVQGCTIAGKEYAYTYDNNGNILSISENDNLVAEYTYDHLNQLTSETRDGKVYTYSYDSSGNMQTIKEDGTVIKTYGYGDSN